ncbi:hypothetical protein B9Z55_017768 [Caenorhabditis nigoni]|uniref:GH18 domain-containing protein n=1 Tax=Caenorhabditis nigoni TaxID=1611254 RepID=A0A2G5TAZ6_9PELO|nr:hypothetical protein B9Z55_017768 [Caenorhabditis nigoni]
MTTRSPEHRKAIVYDPLEVSGTRTDNYQGFMSKKSNRVCFYFSAGFIMSTILALVSYSLVHGVLTDETSDVPAHRVVIPGPASATVEAEKSCGKRVVAYHDIPDREITGSQLSKLTHLILMPVQVQLNGTLAFRSKGEERKFKIIVNEAKRVPNLKIMFSFTESMNNHNQLSKIVDNRETKEILLNSILSFIMEHHLDGVDVQWRWPKTATDYFNLIAFCKDLREKLQALAKSIKRMTPFTLSVIFPRQKPSIDFNEILGYVDFITIETGYYDLWSEQFPNQTVQFCPLYSKKFEEASLHYTMKEYSCITKQPHKFNIFVEFVGRFWENVIAPQNSSRTIGLNVDPMKGKKDWIPWWKVIKWNMSAVSWDDESKTSYIWDVNQRKYLVFESERSLREKIKYAFEKNIGGLAVWRIDHDDYNDTMLSVLTTAKLCLGNNSDDVNYTCD